MIIPVVLSGGSGSRLWPLSRAAHPKQFLSLVEESSLLGSTLERVAGIASVGAPLVIANADHRFKVAAELQRLGQLEKGKIILEPMRRNTAPAIAAAAHVALQVSPEAIILVLPADHVIKKFENFHRAVDCGARAAASGKLVTFGIVPEGPHTGYGYIHATGQSTDGWKSIERFVEKPDAQTAKRYVDSGEYYWNSGMFLFRAQVYLDELETFAPEMVSCTQAAVENAASDLDFLRLNEDAFARSPSDSIDYAVMEKTSKAVMVPLDAQWSDVGSWDSLWEIGEKDAADNVTRGDVMLEDSHRCYVHAENRLVTALGVTDQVIVETSDAILVADRSRVEEVKQIVARLHSAKRPEYEIHKRVFRPWGSYETIALESRFQVKRIIVNPGHRLSLQMHHHRAEHWVVVRGTALVRRGEEEILLSEDESTYLPLGIKHFLANPGLIPLELIEVQTGSYLGEDDIVRFDDKYGRS